MCCCWHDLEFNDKIIERVMNGGERALYAAVNEVVKKLMAETISEEQCAKTIQWMIAKRKEMMIQVAPTEKLEEIFAAAKTELQEKVLGGVDEVIHSDEVTEGMVKLRRLIAGSSKDAKGWRPTGIPRDDIAGHLQPPAMISEKNLLELKQKLEAEVEKKQMLFKETESRAQTTVREAPDSNGTILQKQ